MKKIYNKYKQIINYIIFGALTTLISLFVYFVLVNTILNPDDAIKLQIANVISWIAGVLFAYITNRRYVFKSMEKNKTKEATKFFISRITTLLIDMLIMFIGVTLFGVNDKIIKVISQIIVVISNYIFSKLLVFKK